MSRASVEGKVVRKAARRGRRLAPVLGMVSLGLVLLLGALPAGADVIFLETGGQVRGEIVEETETQVIVRMRSGIIHVIDREEILRIERESDPQAEFARRLAAVPAGDADGYYELGRWAEERGLKEEARQAWLKAIEIAPDHAAARAALGHRKHRGRWYDEEGYKKAVEGLVRWNGQWVTPLEREFYEQGFTKNDKGEWVRREDLERQRAGGPAPPAAGAGGGERERAERRRADDEDARRAGGSGAGSRPRPGSGVLPPPAEPEEADTAWYDDHTTVMSWEEALKRPYETRYYRIYTNIKPEYAQRYGRMLDTYSIKGFQKVFNAKKNLPYGVPKGDVYIYPSQQAFMTAEGMGPSVGGFYQPGARRVVAYHGRFGASGTTKTVLAHEATHQFEDYVLPGKMWNAPVWIIEGFAVFFESAKYDAENDKVIIGHIPRDRLSNLKHGLATNTLIPLSELIRTPQPSFTGYHYAHAWALVYYMIYGGSEKKRVACNCAPRCKNQREHNQRIFSNLFFLARTKKMTPEDTEELFGGKEGFAAFEEQWKQWLADVPYDFDPTTQDFDDIRRGDRDGDAPGRGGASGEEQQGEDATRPRGS
ncbi:MAG: hypothetical protein KatS3mg102_1809 [Planctomycetota bacterium]|nr:MAG: hypothetical protein KatS3mg102_1809 [Planctomycetota bacterium]